MKPFNTCVVKIYSENNNLPQINYKELLCELDYALETKSYDIVCMGDRNAFSIADIKHETEFSTYIQFDFSYPVEKLEQIEEEIREQITGACCIDIIKTTDNYRLLLVEKCDISFN